MKSMAPTLGKLLYDDSNTESARFYKSSTKKKLIASEAFMVGVWVLWLIIWWKGSGTVWTPLFDPLNIALFITICAFFIFAILELWNRHQVAITPTQIFENAIVCGKEREVYLFSDLEVVYWNPLFEYMIVLPKKDIKQRPFIIEKDLIYEKDKFKSILRERVRFDEEKDFTVKKALREKKRKKNQKNRSKVLP